MSIEMKQYVSARPKECPAVVSWTYFWFLSFHG